MPRPQPSAGRQGPRRRPLLAAPLDDLAHALACRAVRGEQLRGGALRLVDDREQKMLRSHERAVPLRRAREGASDERAELGPQAQARRRRALPRGRGGRELRGEGLEVDREVRPRASQPRGVAANEGEEEMLGADLILVGPPGLPEGARQRSVRVAAQAVDGSAGPERGEGPSGVRPGGRPLRRMLPERGDHLVADLLERDAERFEDARGDALAFADETEQQMLGADVAVAELARLVDRQLADLLRARRERDLARRGRRLAATDDELDRGPDLGELYPEPVEDPSRDAFALTHQTEQQVLGPDVVVVEADGLVLGERKDPLLAVVESIKWSHLALFERYIVQDIVR